MWLTHALAISPGRTKEERADENARRIRPATSRSICARRPRHRPFVPPATIGTTPTRLSFAILRPRALQANGRMRRRERELLGTPAAPCIGIESLARRDRITGKMSPGSTVHRHRIRQRQRKRCDAWIKNPVKTRKNGMAIVRGPRCRTWAMENGRCRVHGGASTGPKSPDGKARVVAAMVEGRRKWVARRRAEGRRFTAGRKTGSAWVTEPMQERARAEAHRLGGGRFTLDRPLALALLRSAKGDRVWEAKAKTMLDAHEQAEADRDRGQALSVIHDLRARAIAGWSGRAPVPTTLPFAEGARPNAYAPAPYAPTASEDDPTTPAAKLRRNLFLALDLLEETMMGKALDGNVRDKRLAVEAAMATIKAFISANRRR
jgi:hypothetical protein